MAERISDAELTVMDALWTAGRPLTATEVAAAVQPERGWSERTVKTMLGRLVAKRALDFEEDGRRYLYRPLVPRGDHVERESRRLVDRWFGGRAAPLVAHLAAGDGLSRDDIAELEALLRELRS